MRGMILLVTVALTGETHVNEIIAYASRAFAFFYMLQCFVAALVAARSESLPGKTWRAAGFASIGVVCLAVLALGLPSE